MISYNKLWKLLIDKNINKTQLIDKANISTNAMAKLGKNEPVHLDVIIRICEALECQIEDIVEIKTEKEMENEYNEGN
jgi:DNA-binding Xre family transcriptional regulator